MAHTPPYRRATSPCTPRRPAAVEGESNNIVSASVRPSTPPTSSSSSSASSSSRLCVPAENVESATDKLIVAVDVDEVLGRFVESLNEYVLCVAEFGERAFSVEDYFVYEFAKVWNCSPSESNRIVHEFFDSRHFRDGIAPIPGAFESLQRIKETQVSLNVVTSRQHVIQEPTLAWLGDHYGGIFDGCFFGNHFSLSGASKKKSELCREIGAAVLIDDNVNYALECADAGIDVLLFDWNGKYPWSKQSSGAVCVDAHPRVRRVENWRQVELELASIRNERVIVHSVSVN